MYYLVDKREPGIRIGGYFFTREAAEKKLADKCNPDNIRRTKNPVARAQLENMVIKRAKSSKADSSDRSRQTEWVGNPELWRHLR